MKYKLNKEQLSEQTFNIYDENAAYIDSSIETIHNHFKTINHKWGKTNITRDMIEETIVELIQTITQSDERLDCNEAGTGGIIIQIQTEEENPEYHDLTILLEL